MASALVSIGKTSLTVRYAALAPAPGGHQIGGQGDHEQLLAAEPVGEPAEEQGTETRAQDVDGGAKPGHLGLGDVDPAARLRQLPGDVADDRDFEAVEYPDGTEPNDDHPVPAGPGQPVQARRDLRGYRPGLNITHAAVLPSGEPPAAAPAGAVGRTAGPAHRYFRSAPGCPPRGRPNTRAGDRPGAGYGRAGPPAVRPPARGQAFRPGSAGQKHPHDRIVPAARAARL